MKTYKCTNCGHEFKIKFKRNIYSKTALCPLCYAGAKMVVVLKKGLEERNKKDSNFGMDCK